MKFAAALALLAAVGVSASVHGGDYKPSDEKPSEHKPSAPTEKEHVKYTTEVVTAYTTYCPEATTFTHGDKTYTVTEATTLTITDGPYTVSKPVVSVTSKVYCHGCESTNSTATYKPTEPAKPTHVTAGAGKTAVISGAGLVGLLGVAAFIL